MDLLSFNITDYVLAGVLLVLFIVQVYWYSRYMAAPARQMRRERKKTPANDHKASAPGVSVILAAHNESYNLSKFLPSLLTQDYPLYEVIVVDDGSEDTTRAIVEQYLTQDPRLHITFVPYGARVQSTKKLALTLAAKAAQYEWLLLTDADCVPESNHWISAMMEKAEKEIILGFGAYFYEKGHVNRLVRFDTLFNGLHYLGDALCGHPYMGVGRNLAYRKEFFFASGGFTRMMTNRAGDDDLFVNHVATADNTSVALSRDSFTWSIAKKTLHEWLQQKRRHLSVSPAYRAGTKIRLAVEPVTRGLFYAAILAAVAYGIRTSYFLPLYMALALFLVRWILQTAIINISAGRMGLHTFNMFSVLWFDIVLPLVSLWMLIVPKKQTKW